METQRVRIHVLPGGALPKRETPGAIGFDVRLRAIVSGTEMDPDNPRLRKTLFDFKRRPPKKEDEQADLLDLMYAENGAEVNGEIVYRLWAGESVLVGIGFVTEMVYPMFYWVAPRSGLSSKHKITVTNAPGTVDPDYRGEAGVLVHNRGEKSFDLTQGMRIAQIIFQEALIPELDIVEAYADLGESARGAGGFGSTGLT